MWLGSRLSCVSCEQFHDALISIINCNFYPGEAVLIHHNLIRFLDYSNMLCKIRMLIFQCTFSLQAPDLDRLFAGFFYFMAIPKILVRMIMYFHGT